jgi:hypothetical protein
MWRLWQLWLVPAILWQRFWHKPGIALHTGSQRLELSSGGPLSLTSGFDASGSLGQG